MSPPDDPDVWSVTCFLVRPGFRGLGVTRALLAAAVARAREHGASAVEGYTRVLEQDGHTEEYGRVTGSHDVFAEAGFVEVTVPSGGRRVLRLEL